MMDAMVGLSGSFYVRLSEQEIMSAGDGDFQLALINIFGHTGIDFEDVTDSDDNVRLA